MIRGLSGVNDQGIVAGVPKPVLTVLIVAALLLTAGAIGAAIMHRSSSLVFMTVGATALYMALLWQRNYAEYMALHEVVAVQGRYMLPFVVPMLAIGLIGIKLYVDQLKKAPRRLAAFARHIQTIHPDEAYEFSKNYWAERIASRRLTDS